MQHRGERYEPLRGRTLGMIFEKSSTRTRVSFEVGMVQLGGHALFLSPRDTQLGRGEPIEDSARVLSRMVDCVMIRTFEQEKLESFAGHSRVPVINALTDREHPLQLLADMQTYFEHRGDIRGGASPGSATATTCATPTSTRRGGSGSSCGSRPRRATSPTRPSWPRPATPAP